MDQLRKRFAPKNDTISLSSRVSNLEAKLKETNALLIKQNDQITKLVTAFDTFSEIVKSNLEKVIKNTEPSAEINEFHEQVINDVITSPDFNSDVQQQRQQQQRQVDGSTLLAGDLYTCDKQKRMLPSHRDRQSKPLVSSRYLDISPKSMPRQARLVFWLSEGHNPEFDPRNILMQAGILN